MTVVKNLVARFANLEDADILFEWQNHPETRKYFRNPKTPTVEEHSKWIERALTKDKVSLFIIEVGSVPKGVLRFDEQLDGTLEISILVAPENHNKGIGSAVLALAREIRPLATLVADVKPDNTASKIIFKKAGYITQNNLLVSFSPVPSPRLAICPDGSPGSGLGHVRRCMGLAKKLSEVANSPLFFISSNSRHLDLVKENGFKIVEYSGAFGELFDVTQGVEILILDSYKIDPLKVVKKKKQSTTVVVFDDLGVPHKFADIIINGSPAAQNNQYDSEDWQTLLFGAKYQIIRDDIHHTLEIKKNLKPKHLLVTLGSGDDHNMIPGLLRVLQQINPLKNELQVDFVIGSETSVPKGVGLPNINFVSANDLPNKLKKADVALVGGGQSLVEVVYSGVPSIAICLAENQMKNIRSLFRLSCIFDFVRWDDIDWEQKVSRSLRLLFSDKEERFRLMDACLRVFDNRGADRITDVILDQHMLKQTRGSR